MRKIITYLLIVVKDHISGGLIIVRKIITYLLIVVFIYYIGYIFHYNLFNYNAEFFKTSITNILTLIIAVFVAFFLTQQKTDERKRKDKVENVVEKIASFSESEEALFHFGAANFDSRAITVKHRRISNLINFLDKCKSKAGITKQVNVIKEQFRLYKEYVSDNFNYEALNQSDIRLLRHLTLIESKCDEIIQILYK